MAEKLAAMRSSSAVKRTHDNDLKAKAMEQTIIACVANFETLKLACAYEWQCQRERIEDIEKHLSITAGQPSQTFDEFQSLVTNGTRTPPSTLSVDPAAAARSFADDMRKPKPGKKGDESDDSDDDVDEAPLTRAATTDPSRGDIRVDFIAADEDTPARARTALSDSLIDLPAI